MFARKQKQIFENMSRVLVRVGVATGVGPDEWKSIRVAFSFLQSYIHTHNHYQLKLNHFFLRFED